MRVYRIQDAEGRGPFRPGFTKQWIDKYFVPGMQDLPSWMDEFGWDLILRLGRPGEHFGTAVHTLEKLSEWFSPTEIERLRTFGFQVVSLRPNRVLAESKNQLVFARRSHLAHGVVVIPWPIVLGVREPLIEVCR